MFAISTVLLQCYDMILFTSSVTLFTTWVSVVYRGTGSSLQHPWQNVEIQLDSLPTKIYHCSLFTVHTNSNKSLLTSTCQSPIRLLTSPEFCARRTAPTTLPEVAVAARRTAPRSPRALPSSTPLSAPADRPHHILSRLIRATSGGRMVNAHLCTGNGIHLD